MRLPRRDVLARLVAATAVVVLGTAVSRSSAEPPETAVGKPSAVAALAEAVRARETAFGVAAPSPRIGR